MEPSGGVGKAAAELIKEMQQAQQELDQVQNNRSDVEKTLQALTEDNYFFLRLLDLLKSCQESSLIFFLG